ncbi:hypothetical protein ACFV6E_22940 [Streptomyces sp. NPDC059785]|uniref:hypothetical protein n=1 Tax=Streptomyces sp. NPDC059785 TaxID=3346945 RepID=UPI003654DF79
MASVRAGPGHGRVVCSVTGVDAVPTGARVWRGCGESTAPGDTLPVVYDPRGLAPARGVAAPGELLQAELRLAGLTVVFVAGCAIAVVRSFELTSRPSMA